MERPELHPTEWVVHDERFEPCRGERWLTRLHTGCAWTEGPVWVPAGRYLLFSDIPRDEILRWDETTGAVGVFRNPSGHSNGNTLDRQGRLISCEHGGRRVTRTEHDGSVTVLADRFEGRRFNSPNDVVVRSDGSVWFTDPTYGIRSHYEGGRSAGEIGSSNLYRLDPATGECRIAASGFAEPNGLAFSLDERTLYVSDSERREMCSFAVSDGGLGERREFAACPEGTFDGFRLDDEGRLWVSAGDGVYCYHADGTLLGVLKIPEVVSNLTFGGRRRNRLFITATTSVYAVLVGARGPNLLG